MPYCLASDHRVSVFTQWQPFVDGVYVLGRSLRRGYDSTLVRLDTDEGIVGWGEMAPLGSFYDPSFAAVRARAADSRPVGARPRPAPPLDADSGRRPPHGGHPYAKSALDMAAWGAAGIAAGIPLAGTARWA